MLRDWSQEAYGPIPSGSLRNHSSASEAMQTTSSRWGKLHSFVHPSLKRTKWALDLHRRLALLCCGQETEAVENFQAPGYWKGFELCYLCVCTFDIYKIGGRPRKPGRLGFGIADLSQIGNRCLYWLQRAERALPSATEGARAHEYEHEQWPLLRLKVLQLQANSLKEFGRRDVANNVWDRFLYEQAGLFIPLPFDFPVPLPDIQYLKWDILQTYVAHSGRHDLMGLEVPEIGPEVLDMLDVAGSDSQTAYALACLVLRGQKLISNTEMVEKGLHLYETCRAKLDDLSEEGAVSLPIEGLYRCIIASCFKTMESDLIDGVHLDRVDKLVAFLRAQGMEGVLTIQYVTDSFMRKVWAVCGFSGPATFMPGSVVPALSPSKAVLEAFWESYRDSCTAIKSEWLEDSGHGEHRYEVKRNRVRTVEAWLPFAFLFRIHAVAATISKLLAPNGSGSGEAASPESPPSPGTGEAEAGGDFARQALLALESARNYKGTKEFGPVNDWERIKRAHQACGPDAVFVQFAGGRLQNMSGCLGMFDVCIVVQDEGVASCHRLERIDSDSILENVQDISDACLEMNLESECCRNALETLYDLLIRPLFHTFIGQNDIDHLKLVISAVGCFQDVPFSILRNKDSGCYLFQEVKLAFTPSFAMLDSCRLRYESLQEKTLLAGAGAAVALGDPNYYPYLPGTRKEVDAICQVFDFCRPEYQIVKLLDDDATLQRLLECVKMPSPGVEIGTQCSQAFIHIAAHGTGGELRDHGTIFLTRGRRRRRSAAQREGEGEGEGKGKGKGMRDESASSDEESYEFEPEALESQSAAEGLDFLSRLLRSRSRSSDVGIGTSLHCDDIMLSGLEWCAYMVVLSACNTGVGVTLHNNDLDVLSFSRAFVSAGVPCSVLARWRVDDDASLHLMKLFYEALSQGEDACSALQSAMIQMHQTGNYTLHQIGPFLVTGLPTVCLPPQMRRGPALDPEITSISKLQI